MDKDQRWTKIKNGQKLKMDKDQIWTKIRNGQN